MRKKVLIAVIILAVIGVGISAFVLAPSSTGTGVSLNSNCKELTESKSDQSAFIPSTGCEMAEQENVQSITDILAGLHDALGKNDTSSLSPEAVEFLKSHKPSDILPTGMKLEILQDSWRRTGLIGSVTVNVSGPYIWSPQSKFKAVFQNSEGGWQLSNTLKL